MKTLTQKLIEKVEELRAAYLALIVEANGEGDTGLEWEQYKRLGRIGDYLETRLGR